MKLLYFFLVAFLCASGSLGEGIKCIIKPANLVEISFDMVESCASILQKQINIEAEAAMTYLAMGAHFARDIINRPGFSKFFFEAANEEREHAIKITEYLLMRGQLKDNITEFIRFPSILDGTYFDSGFQALKTAYKLETQVTNNIRDIIKKCENPGKEKDNFNDYHVVDYFTEEFLNEQYKSERDLAGKLSTLGKMIETHGELGEFLFDKKLLNNEL